MLKKKFFTLKVEVAAHWGLSPRITPYSKTRRVLKLPPPTTLIGALAYPYTRYKGLPENISLTLSSATLLSKIVVSVHASLEAQATIYGDVNRVYWYHKARGQAKTDAVALEKMYLTPTKDRKYPTLNVVYVVDPEKAEELLGFWWSETLEALAWSITRIGNREATVSTLNVEPATAVPEETREIETNYYIPSDVVKSVKSGEYTLQEYVPPTVDIGDYSTAERLPYIIPYSFLEPRPARVSLELKEEAIVLRVGRDRIAFNKSWAEEV